ncbi:hypothetical protein ACPC54_06450 [Kitasatospora sp. NPDC094028]
MAPPPAVAPEQAPPKDRPRDGQTISASPLEAAPRALALLRAARAELDEALQEYRDGLTEVYRLQTMPGWRGTKRLYEELRWEVADLDERPTRMEQARYTPGYRWDYRTANRRTYYLTMTVSAEGIVELEGSGPDGRRSLPATAQGVDSFLGPIRDEERRSKRMTDLLLNGGALPLKPDGTIDFEAVERGEF